MSQERIETLLARNRAYAETHTPPPALAQGVEIVKQRGSLVILTCSDPRVNLESYLNFGRGEVSVIRNAGGRAMDSMRTLQVLDTVGNVTAVMIVHHTDCGGLFITDGDVHERMRERSAEEAGKIGEPVFGTFRDIGIEESVRQDMAAVRGNKFLREDLLVVGYVLDLKSGLLKEVV